MRELRYFLLVVIILIAGCKQKEISSQPIKQPIVIDGKYGDWEGAWYYFDNFQANLAVANDSQFFYLCLKTSDRQLTRRIFSRGLIVSFNPEGKKKPTLSIFYPLGGPLGRFRSGGRLEEQPYPLPDRGPIYRPANRLGEQREDFEPPRMDFVELEIRQGKDETGVRYAIDQLTGLAVKIARQEGELVYELRIPLSVQPENTCGLNLKPGKALAIGIKIPEIDLSAMRERFGDGRMPPGSMPPGEMPGGRGGGMGGGFPGDHAAGGQMSSTSQEIWFRVRI